MVSIEYFNNLPEEITLEILSRVETESVLECKLVCRNWGSLVSQNPCFSKMHLHHLNHLDSGKFGFIALTLLEEMNENLLYFEYNEPHESTTPKSSTNTRITRFNFIPPLGRDARFLGSCNGLICLTVGQFSAEICYVCNPITRECIMLPEIKRMKEVRLMDSKGGGFGYVSSTNEYKVVRIMTEMEPWELSTRPEFMEVHIYTLGSGHGWRDLGKINFGTTDWGNGFFVDGVLYWMDYSSHMMIYPFDLAEEKFCEHLSPPLPSDDFEYGKNKYELGIMDGCLSCFVKGVVDRTKLCWDVWLLKKKKNDNYVMKEGEAHHSMGWSKEFRVDNHPFAVTKRYHVLTYHGKCIYIHDLGVPMSDRIVAHSKEWIFRVFPHRNTLVSLTELGEEVVKKTESVKIEETESYDQPFNQLSEDEI